MASHIVSLLRLARLSGNHDPAPAGAFNDYLIEQLDKPTTAIGRLSPLLLNNLEKNPDTDPELLRRLRFASGVVRQLHQLQQEWLGKALALLGENGISVILLKAAAFNGDIYPAQVPRIGSDLDLLVKPGQYEQARELLATLFEPETVPENEKATSEELWETSFSLPQNLPCTLDLHREIGSSLLFPVDTRSLFERSIPHPVYAPAPVRCLGPEDQLIHLAVHAARDLTVTSHNLLDAHELWSNYEPDSEKLLQLASASEARNALYLLLNTCSKKMETDIPDAFLNLLPVNKCKTKLAAGLFDRGVIYKRAGKGSGYKLRQAFGYLLITDNFANFRRYVSNYLNLLKKDHSEH